MNVAIIGAGAMGCRYGAALHKAGANVWLYDVNQKHVDAINKNGLIVDLGDCEEVYNIKATCDINIIDTPDVAILFTKTVYSRNALQEAKKIFDDHTVVVTLQNGLGNIEIIEEFISRNHIAAGITSYASDLIDNGKIKATGSGTTKIMPIDETFSGQIVEELVKTLKLGGLDAIVSNQVMVDIWEKVAFNCCFNPITFLIQSPLGAINNVSEGYALCRKIVSEAVEVAHADGYDVNFEHIIGNVENALAHHQNHKPSMLQDRENGKKCEIDGIVGNVIHTAEKYSIETPTLLTIYTLIKIIESNY